MYSILLVDDERLELEMLTQYIDWHAMDIEVVATARNGKEALEKLQVYKPDIVLTDVKMPIMDGLQLARQIKAWDERIKVVFLSGHDEFDYIKEALSVEAVGYLLKPLDRKELADTMEKVKAKCRKDKEIESTRTVWAEKTLKSLLAATEPEAVSATVGALLEWDSSLAQGVHVGLISVDHPQLVADELRPFGEMLGLYLDSCYTQGLVVETRPGEYLMLLYGEPLSGLAAEAWWNSLLVCIRSRCSFTATIGYEDGVAPLAELHARYRAAKQAADFKFYAGGDRLIARSRLTAADVEGAATADGLPEADKPLLRAVADHDKEKAIQVLVSHYETLAARRVGRDAVYRHSIHILNTLFEEHPRLQEEMKERLGRFDWLAQLYALDSIPGIRDYAIDIFAAAIDHFASRQADRNSVIASKAVAFIDARFHTPITVEDVAASVYLSANYLRTVFKEAMGMTILEYITQKRIAKATELLRDPSLKIHEIAAKVGYDNTSYFCSVFQKHKGYTPNDYRKKEL